MLRHALRQTRCSLAYALALLECTRSAERAPPPTQQLPVPSQGALQDGYWRVPGAPDPLACTTDAECVGDTVPDETGCCVTRSTP
jgi:hypothetical protein